MNYRFAVKFCCPTMRKFSSPVFFSAKKRCAFESLTEQKKKLAKRLKWGELLIMAVCVVKFLREGYKIRLIFDKKSTNSMKTIVFCQ